MNNDTTLNGIYPFNIWPLESRCVTVHNVSSFARTEYTITLVQLVRYLPLKTKCVNLSE